MGVESKISIENNNLSPVYLSIMKMADEQGPERIKYYQENSDGYSRNFKTYNTKLFYMSGKVSKEFGKSDALGSTRDHYDNNPILKGDLIEAEILVRATEIIEPDKGKKLRENLDIIYNYMNKKE